MRTSLKGKPKAKLMLIWIQSFSVSISIQHFAGGAGQDRQKKEQRNKEAQERMPMVICHSVRGQDSSVGWGLD